MSAASLVLRKTLLGVELVIRHEEESFDLCYSDCTGAGLRSAGAGGQEWKRWNALFPESNPRPTARRNINKHNEGRISPNETWRLYRPRLSALMRLARFPLAASRDDASHQNQQIDEKWILLIRSAGASGLVWGSYQLLFWLVLMGDIVVGYCIYFFWFVIQMEGSFTVCFGNQNSVLHYLDFHISVSLSVRPCSFFTECSVHFPKR